MTTFTEFFAGDWQRMLDAVEIPEMPGASWDRKAAYLYQTKGNEMAGKRAGRKPAVNDSAARISEALSFIKIAVSASAPDDFEDMAYLAQGWAIGHDGVIAAGMPLGEQDISGYVNHKLLTTAIGNVGKELVITSGDAGIVIKSGDYEALIPHGDVSQYRPANPDQMQWPIDNSDGLRAALEVASRVVKTTAEHVRDAAIYNNGQTLIATDGGTLVEAFHGNNLPPGLVLPRPFAIAINKTDKKIVGFGFDQTEWKTFTIWFEDQSFIRTNLYPFANYPQSVVTKAADMFTQPHTVEPPKGFFEAVKAVYPFGPIAFVGGAVVANWDGSAFSTAQAVKGLPDGGCFYSGARVLAWDDATAAWFGDAEQRRLVFLSSVYRAVVAATTDPMPDVSQAAAPHISMPDPATAPAWGSPPAAAAPAAPPVPAAAPSAVTMPYTPVDRQPPAMRGAPGWDKTPYTLAAGETIEQFVSPEDNPARVANGWPENPTSPVDPASAPWGIPAGSAPAATPESTPSGLNTGINAPNSASPSERAPSSGEQPAFAAPFGMPAGAAFTASPVPSPQAPSAAPAGETAPSPTIAEQSPSSAPVPAWLQQPANTEPAFSFAAFEAE